MHAVKHPLLHFQRFSLLKAQHKAAGIYRNSIFLAQIILMDVTHSRLLVANKSVQNLNLLQQDFVRKDCILCETFSVLCRFLLFVIALMHSYMTMLANYCALLFYIMFTMYQTGLYRYIYKYKRVAGSNPQINSDTWSSAASESYRSVPQLLSRVFKSNSEQQLNMNLFINVSLTFSINLG